MNPGASTIRVRLIIETLGGYDQLVAVCRELDLAEFVIGSVDRSRRCPFDDSIACKCVYGNPSDQVDGGFDSIGYFCGIAESDVVLSVDCRPIESSQASY